MSALRERMIDQFGKVACSGAGLYPADIPLFCVPRDQFNEAARTMKYAEARLVAEWAADETLLGRGFAVYACYNRGTEFLVVKSRAPGGRPNLSLHP